jgi:hypothetical protein
MPTTARCAPPPLPIPTFDDQGIDLCKDADTNAGTDVDVYVTQYTKNVDVAATLDGIFPS